MLNKIIDGISVALDVAFNDVTIYSESIEQGFEEPCFFILPLNPSQSQIIGNRYRREYPFNIQYFPSSGQEQNHEMNGIAERLLQVLEYIAVGEDLIRGTKMNFEKIEGVLHFFISYKLHVRKEIPIEEPMDEMAVANGLKE